jgi:hypothetical protein
MTKPSNGTYLKLLMGLFISLILGAFGYTFAVDNKKVDKREMDQFCSRFDRMDAKLDKLLSQPRPISQEDLVQLLKEVKDKRPGK